MLHWVWVVKINLGYYKYFQLSLDQRACKHTWQYWEGSRLFWYRQTDIRKYTPSTVCWNGRHASHLTTHKPVCLQRRAARRLWVHPQRASWGAPPLPRSLALCRCCPPQRWALNEDTHKKVAVIDCSFIRSCVLLVALQDSGLNA